MDAEQIKLIMEMLAQMGANGKEAFIWWLVFDKALGPVVSLILVPFSAWVLINLFGRYSENEQRLRAIRDAMGVGTRGIVTEEEAREIMRRINRVE